MMQINFNSVISHPLCGYILYDITVALLTSQIGVVVVFSASVLLFCCLCFSRFFYIFFSSFDKIRTRT